eukprot:TRINITY_DN1035_c0_g1_i1.p1 TRINITY_DN1035_c0_g1~~TRINITY_DN1035_c0_g1_i1.p1  ORF type:complete len:911 (-),score=212.39 TRINITY_DN1035_c0_g1_i1:135-2867(-)
MAKYLNPDESTKRYLTREAPLNYIAGLGRGAIGFTTRSDLGDARMDISFGGGGDKQETTDDNADAGLFSMGTWDAEDDEADRIYAMIDERMENKRKTKNMAREKAEQEEMERERPKIQAQFADAKEELSKVSFAEWNSIQDPGNYSRAKKAKVEHYTAAPNSLLEQAKRERGTTSTVQDAGMATPMSGMFTPATPMTDLTKVGEVKQTIMKSKLAAVSDSVTGQTSVDPKGYLTQLSQQKIATAAEVGDKKRAGLLLDSVLTSNPKHGPAWIARARLEEASGKLVRARKYIIKGTEECPTSQDVWLEAARLHQGRDSQEILATAVSKMPEAVSLWLAAARLEVDPARQKRVFRKALENVPNSVKLWRAAVQLEKEADAKVMLAHAVECVPSSVEMWLAWAKLEDYDGARKVLNRARATVPTERAIWLTAAQLEEAHGSSIDIIRKVIRKGIKSLAAHGVHVDREQWIKEAENCERQKSLVTCSAVINETIGLGVEDEDRKATWVEDAETLLQRGSTHTAKAIYAHTTSVFPSKKSLWLRLARVEKEYGDSESLKEILAKSVKYCINSEVLWLMYAKHTWQELNDVVGARTILKQAFNANPDNESIWLAAVKLEKETGSPKLAREVLGKARTTADTPRVWMKSALLERDQGRYQEEEELLQQSLKKFPAFHKFYLMLGQLKVQMGKPQEAKMIYTKGIKSVSAANSISLWLSLARLEERLSGFSRSRAIVEKARTKNPKNPLLWLEAIRNEFRNGESRIAFNMMAKALQDCPTSGLLWAEAIKMESRAAKKARSVDALKRCDQDPHVILSVAQLFHQNRTIEKARLWYHRCVSDHPTFGDAWAAAYQFEVENGTKEQQEIVLKHCLNANPRYGEKWISVSKDPRNHALSLEKVLLLVAAKFAGINKAGALV